MKLILILLLLTSINVFGQQKFHELQVETAYDGRFDMSLYKGQKVVVAAISIEQLNNKSTLVFWDSLQAANPKVGFIIIPATDIGTNAKDTSVDEDVKGRTSKRIVLSGAGKVKKTNKERQHPIMQWLTNSKQNSHFDMEVESDVQIYIISATGELYAVLSKDTSQEVLQEALKRDDSPRAVLTERRL